MNFFAHALPHLEDPYLAVGSCIPDLIRVADRKSRVREKHAQTLLDDADPWTAAIAHGIVLHHRDDLWFHQTRAFNQLMLQFAQQLRKILGEERSMRPGFVGHVVVEMLLDAFLQSRYPGKLEFFYEQLESVDENRVQTSVNRIATKDTKRLADVIVRFRETRFLFDYDTDAGIAFRMNQVLNRVSLHPLPARFTGWLPRARQEVYNRATELLADYAIEV
jgi:hypothetical protein